MSATQRKVSKGNCVHCRRHCAYASRRLCWTCSKAPGVRDRYPMVRATSSYRAPEPPKVAAGARPEPTRALPGTPEKVQVIFERLWSGLPLWDERDAKIDVT